MKTKLEMAHDYAMLHMMNLQYKDVDDLEMVQWAFDYADAMQAEADKRKPNPVLPALHQTFIDGVEQPRYAEEWQPDWSQAPNRAMYWAMDGCGQCNWYEREPEVFGSQWEWGSVIEQTDTGYDYQGDWRDSLRKRPE